jgi:hypothetical protein
MATPIPATGATGNVGLRTPFLVSGEEAPDRLEQHRTAALPQTLREHLARERAA